MASNGGADDGDVVDGLNPTNRTPFLSSVDETAPSADVAATEDDDDIEALASKACALASVPVPDYADAIHRDNIRSKAKYGNRFTIDDNEEVDDVEEEEEDKEFASSGMVLAEKTSQILQDFEGYVSGIGETKGDVNKEILKGGEEAVTFQQDPALLELASKVRADNKKRIMAALENKAAAGAVGRSSFTSNNSGMQREWAASNSSDKNVGGGHNLHDPLYSGATVFENWGDDPEEGRLNTQRGQKYTHPLLQSKRMKLGALNCLILAAIVFGVSIGVTSRDSKEAKELGDKVAKVQEELAGGGGGSGGGGGGGDDMTDDWNFSLPAHDVTGAQGTAVKPSSHSEEELTDEQYEAYQSVIQKYKPITYNRADGWDGKDYLDAYMFCNRLKFEDAQAKAVLAPLSPGTEVVYDVCPYDAVCPLGLDAQPLGGFRHDENSENIWTPISDTPNDWAQLSRDNACARYSAEHEHPPEWGVKGFSDMSGGEDYIPHLMCCISQESLYGEVSNAVEGSITEGNIEGWGAYGNVGIKPSNPAYKIYIGISEYYKPLAYDRSKGWQGKTYIEALQFCGKMDGYEICPYEAICPMGTETEPMGGYKDEVEGSWSPILDGANDWVSVSPQDSCVKYSGIHGKPPEWSITGLNSEGMTRHILCCMLKDTPAFAQPVAVTDDVKPSQPIADDVKPSGIDSAPDVAPTTDNQAHDDEEAAKWQAHHDEEAAKAEEDAKAQAMAYKDDGTKYHPATYGREDGWVGHTYADAIKFCAVKDRKGKKHELCPYNAICPLGPDTEPIGGYYRDIEQLWIPIKDDANDWVQMAQTNGCLKFSAMNPNLPEWGISGEGAEEITQKIMCCLRLDSEDDDGDASAPPSYEEDAAYESVAEKYQPLLSNRNQDWEGQTYLEAVEYCGKKDSHSLCPYEAICPLGPGSKPLGGNKDDEGSDFIWYPLLGTEAINGNDWVAINSGNRSCQRYSDEHGGNTPAWGLSGENSEAITRNIICCLFIGDQALEAQEELDATMMAESYTEAEEQAIMGDVMSYRPVLYSRRDDWEGKTYLEAVQFCARREGYEICPYEAICPMGIDSMPVEGYLERGDGKNVWVPVSDDANDWVNIGTENSCVRYKNENPDGPEWGMTSDDKAEEWTQNIMCCEGSIWGNAEESFLYEIAAMNYHPMWFDREKGWTGTTYDEAATFCPQQGDGSMSLCPYEAYCPMADMDIPLGGMISDEPNGSWAAVKLEKRTNVWVSIGPENTCQIYGIVNGKDPEWGITGENEELTRHIMCCGAGDNDDGALTAPKPAITPKPSNVAYTVISPTTTPEPTAKTTPEPSPEPTPDPTPQPTPDPTPEPTSDPTPEPTSDPTPEPTSDPTPQPTPEPSNDPTPKPPPLPSNRPSLPPIVGSMSTAVEAYKTAETFNPQWYGRDTGWNGQTYDAAFEFCSQKGPNHDICPYEVLCPGGPLNMPYGGAKNERDGSWAPINTPFNSWVFVSEKEACVRYENLNPKSHPGWGITGEDSEDLTRHILCCDMNNAASVGSQVEDDANSASTAYGEIMEKYEPKWFGRDEGWEGKTYVDAITFCASQSSYIPCPYEAYCPNGEGSLPTGGYDGTEEAWAAIMDSPNGFVQIGSYEKNSISNSCMKYNSLNDHPPLWGILGYDDDVDRTPNIMCCKEPENHFITGMDPPKPVAIAKDQDEQQVLTQMDPVWFSSKHGYHGKSHQDAIAFCKTIGDMVLCPKEAYCPTDRHDKLFLQQDPFEGEQWAPAASASGGMDHWISIGQNPSACYTHDDLLVQQPKWATDGSPQEFKEYVLCCQKPSNLEKTQSLKNDLSPIWMDASHGWEGGSHDDATQFCEKFGNRKLCPYSAYCPHGPGQPVMGGHEEDFDTEGEQWAPVYGTKANHWVMIGEKYQNRATTCMDVEQLEGEEPSWGLSKENASTKKYIMCCSF